MSDAPGAPSGTTQGSAAVPPGSSEFNEEIVKACEAVVESFRRQEITKADATARLFRALKLYEVVEAEELAERERAYQSYFDILEDFDRGIQAAAERSGGIASSPTQRNSGEPRIEDDEGVTQERNHTVPVELDGARSHDKSRRSLLDRLSDSPSSKRNRAEIENDFDDDSSQYEKRGRLKRNIDESLFLHLHFGSRHFTTHRRPPEDSRSQRELHP
ncbi:hypothetical protein BN946_scf184794.g9 [Trametes cinnabarina]|uniref:Uncharacterized protein n=1 Tax=Pycnoporus cinnabarinus TaxID=5643 RepID=A0A060SKZ8_PYCCI|nr:hypothetical protein BN946_scf184794.g9 [Trametes cinnabarina]